MDNQKRIVEEVPFEDYIKVIVKRRDTILLTFFICVIAITIVSFLMPKVYQANAVIRIGTISKPSTPLISTPEAIQMLTRRELLGSVIQKLKLDTRTFKPHKMIKIVAIQDPIMRRKETNLLRLEIRHNDPKLAKEICDTLANSFVHKGKELYDKNFILFNERIQELEKRGKAIEKQIEELNQRVLAQPANTDLILLQNTISNYENTYTTLKAELHSLKEKLINLEEFKVLVPPGIPGRPIKPNKILYFAISAILGLALGIFIAFFKEFGMKVCISK